MDGDSRRDRLRSFVLGGVVGASAALAAARRPRPPARAPTPAGLAAFEGAPCFEEAMRREASEGLAPRRAGT
jgi:hypothetical protein